MVCSFCGTSQEETSHLIAGPSAVAICGDCVRLCADIIETETRLAAEARPGTEQQKAPWIRRSYPT